MNDELPHSRFLELARIVETHTGIQMPASKRLMLEGRLRGRMRALGLETLTDYCNAVTHDGRVGGEFDHFIDSVTTHKTDFFREPDHFVFLREKAVPSVLKLKRQPGFPVTLWSAAASNGAEAYSAAMVAADVLGLDGPTFSVLGTDISGQMIEEGRRAIYPLAMADPIPSASRKHYVMIARDADRSEFRIVPELRRKVRFQHLNLMDRNYPVDADFDVIFCRNVLIYFSKPIQEAVIGRVCAHLRPGGYLILGHTESLAANSYRSLRQVRPSVFRHAVEGERT
jgi:chemotaxis methyl-accepting protein methylase